MLLWQFINHLIKHNKHGYNHFPLIYTLYLYPVHRPMSNGQNTKAATLS